MMGEAELKDVSSWDAGPQQPRARECVGGGAGGRGRKWAARVAPGGRDQRRAVVITGPHAAARACGACVPAERTSRKTRRCLTDWPRSKPAAGGT